MRLQNKDIYSRMFVLVLQLVFRWVMLERKSTAGLLGTNIERRGWVEGQRGEVVTFK